MGDYWYPTIYELERGVYRLALVSVIFNFILKPLLVLVFAKDSIDFDEIMKYTSDSTTHASSARDDDESDRLDSRPNYDPRNSDQFVKMIHPESTTNKYNGTTDYSHGLMNRQT